MGSFPETYTDHYAAIMQPSQLHDWSISHIHCLKLFDRTVFFRYLFASSKAAIDLKNESFSTFHILLP